MDFVKGLVATITAVLGLATSLAALSWVQRDRRSIKEDVALLKELPENSPNRKLVEESLSRRLRRLAYREKNPVSKIDQFMIIAALTSALVLFTLAVSHVAHHSDGSKVSTRESVITLLQYAVGCILVAVPFVCWMERRDRIDKSSTADDTPQTSSTGDDTPQTSSTV